MGAEFRATLKTKDLGGERVHGSNDIDWPICFTKNVSWFYSNHAGHRLVNAGWDSHLPNDAQQV